MRLRRSSRIYSVGLAILLILFVVFEETQFAVIRNFYRNFYFGSVYGSIHVERPQDESRVDIAILTVLRDRNNYEEYRLPQESFECYAVRRNYTWIVIDLSTNETLRALCPHSDFMFQRHCVTAEVLAEIPEQWVLFIDADMGVINPNRLIEEWIDNDFNIVFYERIFNFEIMAGSYLVRNSEYSRSFLHFWADYEYKLPNSFHGTDNGAIHSAIFEFVFPEKAEERRKCEALWKQSRSFTDLGLYEACIQHLLGKDKRFLEQIKVLGRSEGWARDTWLTNSMWSHRDFVLHGWQKRKMDAVMFASWPSPLVTNSFRVLKCREKDAGLNWHYKDSFIRSTDEIQASLNKTIGQVQRKYDFILPFIIRTVKLDA